MKTLILDNYDSFTYNLVQYVAELGHRQGGASENPVVFRNDAITLEEIEAMAPTHIIISPGPGHPGVARDFGVCRAVIERLGDRIPILGVCLGHQGIALVFGGSVVRAPEVMHGKTSVVKRVDGEKLANPSIFSDLEQKFSAMRYHSLVAERATLPAVLAVTAETDGLVMALQHRERPIYGVQFHPESIGTVVGKKILNAFLHV